ncbi:MAG TPA: hypothetical protein VH583_13780 [Vicinamibacterales bacterium]
MKRVDGFTTIELTLALGIGIVVTGAIFAVLSSDAVAVETERSDMHQRLRVAVDSLLRDLLDVSAVRPYRSDGASPDAPGTVKSDTISAIGRTVVTYWLKSDDAGGVYQLMSSTSGSPLDVPVVDNVVGLSFSYLGDPRPPTMVRPLSEVDGPWTTYGPAPTIAAVPPYAPRENCVFVDNGSDIPSPRLPDLAAPEVSLVPLTDAVFTDGPWCPDAGAPARWDADLLRVRQVIVHLRVQAAAASLRGPTAVLFAHPGTAASGRRWAPDLDVAFTIAPRNMAGNR